MLLPDLKKPPAQIQLKTILFTTLLFAFISSALPVFGQDTKIFILHSYHQEYPWTKNENTGFVDKLTHELPDRQIVFSTEYLDSKRLRFDRQYQDFFFNYLKQKFHNHRPDLIFCSDDNALAFLVEYKSRLFKDSPVVFCGVNNLAMGEIVDRRQYTGVFEKKEIIPTLSLLKKVDPTIRDILFVGDNSSTHRAIAQGVKSDLASHFPDLQFDFLESSNLSDLTRKLAARKKGFVFLTTIGGVVDDSESVLPLPKTIDALVSAGDFKIISMEDVYIQKGVLGGYVTSGISQGKVAATQAIEILGGTPVPSIPLATNSPNVYMFNYPQLQRFKLKTSQLPEESIILNAPVSFYDEYKYQIWASLFFLASQTVIIFFLITNIVKRKQAENALLQAYGELETKVLERTKDLEEAYEELKATQSQMLQQEKMASIGQLAAGVAHEINNPIGFITSNLTTLLKYIERLTEYCQALVQAAHVDSTPQQRELRKKLKIDFIADDAKDLIHESLDGTDRVSKIVQGLKNFSRIDEAEHADTDINQCMESTINIVWNELKYKATINKEYGDLPHIKCYPHQLNQVFMNLLMNAAQSIADRGEIEIKTWQQSEGVYISVSDTGAGIAPENMSKLFNPFFTTKEVGAGTGLGLSISYDIIKKHNGEITVQSEEGKGSTFTIRIPVA